MYLATPTWVAITAFTITMDNEQCTYMNFIVVQSEIFIFIDCDFSLNAL